MKKNLIIRSKSIYSIDLNYFIDNDIKYLFFDLDNTLDIFTSKVPSESALKLIKELDKNNLKAIIISNNSKKRVSFYAKNLNIDYLYRCYKPFTFKLKKYLKLKKINIENCIIIGDQYLTDVLCAKRLNMRCLFTEELSSKDNALISKFNKKNEKLFIKKDIKKNVLISMEEKYVKR